MMIRENIKRYSLLATLFFTSFYTSLTLAQEPIESYHYVYKEFDFHLNEYFPSVEAPDTQTELLAKALVDTVLPNLPSHSVIVDAGAGTGLHTVLIAKFAAQKKKVFQLFSLDINSEAVFTIAQNVKDNNAASAVTVLQSDFFTKIENQQQVDLIICNPPIMPARIDELQGMSNEKLGNLDYSLASKDAQYSDGLGILRRVVTEGKSFLKPGGKIALVAPDFIGEEKIQRIFFDAGCSCQVIGKSTRKVRPMGVTWGHMELIEQVSGYHFFDETGHPFENAFRAKASDKPIYHTIKVYLGIKKDT